jgi:hypothetical protein
MARRFESCDGDDVKKKLIKPVANLGEARIGDTASMLLQAARPPAKAASVQDRIIGQKTAALPDFEPALMSVWGRHE